MFFKEKHHSLPRKAKRLLLSLALSGCALLQGTVGFASENGDGAEGASYMFPADTKSSSNTVSVTSSGYTINGVTTELTGNLGVVYGSGDEQNSKDASANQISVTGGTMTAVLGGISSSGSANNNRVTITGGTITNGVAGGATFYSAENETVAGDVTGNTVEIRGGQVGHVSGGEVGYIYPTGSSSMPDLTKPYFSMGGNATRNNVTVTGGTVTGGVVGGASLTGNATDNSINIEGGTISGDVVAGEVRYPTSSSVATGNSITISGTPNLSNAYLKGGVLGSIDSPAGNTLNIYTKGLSARNFSGFQYLNFDLPSSTQNGDTILTLSDSAGTDLSDMDIRVGKRWDSGINDLTNSTVTLIRNTSGTITANSGTTLGSYFYDGTTLQYPVTGGGLSSDGHSYTASLGTPFVNPDTQSTTASMMVPSMLISNHTLNLPDPDAQGGDFEPVDGDNHSTDEKGEKLAAISTLPYVNFSASSMSEKTGFGSYIDVDSIGMDAGVAFARNNRHGRLVFAPVVDYGSGDYDTYLSDGTRGTGTAKYWAAGIIARQTNNNGFYYEGSLRAGHANVDFHSSEMRNDGDAPVTFNSTAPVLTGHIRIGRVLPIGPGNTLHVYGYYTHTRQGSMEAELSSGERYRFEKVDNGRLRIGARLTWQRKNQRFYSGIAYQYAINGDATATCGDIDIPKSGQNGSSAMLELGWQIKPNKNTPWVVDVSATGWAGMQKGVSAQIRIKKEF